jgi:hypothetical protein
MFLTTAFAPDRADLEDLILDAPEKVLFCRIAALGPEDVEDTENVEDTDEEDDVEVLAT